MKIEAKTSPKCGSGDRFMSELSLAEGRSQGVGRPFQLSATVIDLTQEEVGVIGLVGEGQYWDLVGRTLGSKGGSFHGSRILEYRGFKAADMDVSIPSGTDSNGARLSRYFAERSVINGTGMFTLICAFMAPFDEVQAGGMNMRDVPDVAGICNPFFDSLEFKR